MAFITAETRSSIVELAMGMLNQAPSTALLNTLIAKSVEGASLQDLADYLATTDAFTAEYPATQTAREFATEMFGKLITGGTLDADINTAVIDLLEGLLIAGTTKAEGFVAVIDFLANPANALHEDLGDIALSFQNRADAAEYFSITKELGGSTDAELAAAIASVTSDADTLTAANEAADATASAEEVVAGQTFTLTTGVETISGGLSDETINAPATSGVTGAAATTLDSGDVIDGGAGTDTLNITMTATNNNSLAGVTVKNVENVYVTGANFQTSGETGAALTAATAAKAASAASLAAAQAAVVSATQQGAAADAVVTLATTVAQGGSTPGALTGGLEGEDAVVAASTITVASAASNAAVATAIAALTGTEVATAAAVTAANTQTALTTAGVTAYTGAQYVAAAKAALLTDAGVALVSTADDLAIQDRATLLANTAETLKTVVDATQQDQATAIQLLAAADYIANHPIAASPATLETTVVAASTATALPTGVTTFTLDQYKAAALAALKADDGSTLITANDDTGPIGTRAAELAAEALAVVNYGSGNFTLAQLNTAAAAALKSATGVSLQTNADDSLAIQARAEKLDATDLGGAGADAVTDTALATATIAAANTEAAKAVVADNTAASALAVATAAAAAVADATLSGADFAGSEQVWLVGADSNKTNLTVTTQTAGLSAVTDLDNKITFGTTGTLAVAGSDGTVDIAGAAGGLTLAGTGGDLTLTNTGGTTEAKAVKALTISTTGAMAVDVAGLAQLTTVTSNGEGGATIGNSGAKLTDIVTGAGADGVVIATSTAVDNTTTAVDETVSADVSTGAGNDTVNIKTTLAGTTTVDTGAGDDTVHVTTISSGAGTITTGEGNDTVYLTATLAANPNMTIDAGDGVDTLVMAGGTFGAVDFLRMNSALSGFEAVTFNTAVGGLDVDELGIGSVAALTFQTGATVVTGVGSQALVLSPAKAVEASDNGVTPARALALGGTDLTATAEGYVAGVDNVSAPKYAGDLSVTSAGYGAASNIEVNAASATITVASIGEATAATSNAEAVVLVTSDVESLVVNLASARGTSTNADNEYVAEFDAGIISKADENDQTGHLGRLSSLKVNGAGVFTIDADNAGAVGLDSNGDVDETLVDLTTIDVSGMIAMADLDELGVLETTTNLSTTTITLNQNVSETVLLGGAKDTITTLSTVAAMDTISGFELTGTAASALVADTDRSDVLDFGGFGLGGTFIKFASTTASTFVSLLSEAGASSDDALVFHFGGDTYVYHDVTGNGLTDEDGLVMLTGTLNLDQLISTNGANTVIL